MDTHANHTEQEEREEQFKQKLLELGIIKEIKRPRNAPQEARTPIKVKGKPISQIIIEERR